MTGKRRARKGRPGPAATAPASSGSSVPPASPAGLPVGPSVRPPVPATMAGSSVLPPGAGRSRRDLRAERKRQQRKWLGFGGVIAAVVVLVIVGVAVGLGVNKATSGGDKPTDPQVTMLIALRTDDRTAPVSLLAAHQASPRAGFELPIPARLLTDVCGFGSQQWGAVFGLPGGDGLARTTLSQLLSGARIDGSLTFTPATLSRLVDAVGGVVVDVDTNVITTAGGAQLVTIPRGDNQRLSGAKAVQFATYVGPGEPPAANLNRFQSVFEAVVTALPAKPARAAAVLQSVGVDRATATTAGELFTGLAADDKSNALLAENVPTQTIDTGGGLPAYRVDTAALGKLAQSQLAHSLPANANSKHTSVVIENGVGTGGLVLSACNRLLPAGYQVPKSGNAPSFGYAKTQIIIYPGNSGDVTAAARVGDEIAALLKVPVDDVVQSAQGTNVADVVVILGRDYKP